MNVVVDNLLTSYKLTGKGRLVLLLHGWGDSSQGLSALQKVLSRKYEVLALDMPGFGGSQAPEQAWDLDDYSRFIRSALSKLNLEQPYAVVGHSNGGALAIRAVRLGMIQPSKLILLAASGVRDAGGARRVLLMVVAKAGKAATFWLPARYRNGLRRRLYGAAGSDMLAVPHMQETFKKTVRQDVQDDAAALDVPTLLVYAGHDDAAPPSYGRRYHRLIKGSRLEIIEDAGHFLHIDMPDEVDRLIEEFLK